MINYKLQHNWRRSTGTVLVLVVFLLLTVHPTPVHVQNESSTKITDNADTLSVSFEVIAHDFQWCDDTLTPFGTVPMLTVLIVKSNQPVISDEDSLTINNGKVKCQDDIREKEIDKLRGKTLDIYSLLMEEGKSFGIREVQRYFGYSSPNLATYHLDKLYQLDLVIKTKDNRYKINQSVSPIAGYESKFNIGGLWIELTEIQAIFVAFLLLLSIIYTLLQVPTIFWPLTLIPSLFFLGLSYIVNST